jgi:hypothetical protein
MAMIITRVELHGANELDYINLHSFMEAEGYARWISANGKRYQLPAGTYYSERFVARTLACTAAERAASRTGRRYGVISTEGPSNFTLPEMAGARA